MIEKGEELWLRLIIHIISKRNDSVNIILLCTLHDLMYPTYPTRFLYYFIYLFVRVSKYFKAYCRINKSVDDWRHSFKNKKDLYSPSFHIHKPFAERAISKSKPKPDF